MIRTTCMLKAARLAAAATLVALTVMPLVGCSLMPEYHRPAPDLPAAWNAF